MGIKNETFEKIKNRELLSEEEKKEMLEDTQRAGFDPSIHQVRASLDLLDSINEFNEKSSKETGKMIKLTEEIKVLTKVMIIGLIIQIGLAWKQNNLTDIQGIGDRIEQGIMRQRAEEFCDQNPSEQESGMYYENGNSVPCSVILKKSFLEKIKFWKD